MDSELLRDSFCGYFRISYWLILNTSSSFVFPSSQDDLLPYFLSWKFFVVWPSVPSPLSLQFCLSLFSYSIYWSILFRAFLPTQLLIQSLSFFSFLRVRTESELHFFPLSSMWSDLSSYSFSQTWSHSDPKDFSRQLQRNHVICPGTTCLHCIPFFFLFPIWKALPVWNSKTELCKRVIVLCWQI